MAKIANVALTNTFDTWRIRTNQAFTRLNQFAINESLLYANTITANVRFVSLGANKLGSTAAHLTIINGRLNANGSANVSANFRVFGNTTLGAVGAGENNANSHTTLINGFLSANGRAVIATNITVSGNTTLGAPAKTISATGLVSVTGRQTISTNLSVSGNTTLGGAGKTQTTTGAWTHTGTQNISTNLTVSGNTTLGASAKTIAATGLVTITGRQTISTNLSVSGNTSTNKLVATSNVDATGVIQSTTGGFRYPDGATVVAPIYIYDSSGSQLYP
jgi:hypothetical protein